MILQQQLRLTDGTIVRRCPFVATGGKTLYCARDGRFFSARNAILTDDGWIMREIKHTHNTTRPSLKDGRCHSSYPFMRKYGAALCHKLIALTWIGPQPEGYQIDHLNGNITDYSADNLQYVTPAENIRRAKILRRLRAAGHDPKALSRKTLLALFNDPTIMVLQTVEEFLQSN